MSKKILVTGGAGFIGSNIVDLFIESGWDAVVLDNLSSGKRENVNRAARFHECDIRSPDAIDVVARETPDVICHQAAQIDVRRSMADPRFDCDVNLGGLINVMEAAVRAGSVRLVMFASSGGAIYGDTAQIPTPESHPPHPVSHYGAAKASGELYLGVYQAAWNIPHAALRYSNVYGPRQDPHGEAGVVAIFCGRLLEGKPCMISGDGRQTRDYVFVADVARANLMAAEKLFQGALNIGTGVETDVNEVYRLLAEAAGSSVTATCGPARAGEQRRSCIDPRAAQAALGWTPRTPLADGLAHTLEWFRSQKTR